MTEQDEYDKRIAALKVEIFDIGGRLAMLSPGNHEGRAYWYRAADKADHELRTLIEHGDELRALDTRILYVSDEINAERRRLDRWVAGWTTVSRWLGVSGGLLLLVGAVSTTIWLLVVGFVLVIACWLARSRAERVRREPSQVILDRGLVMSRLEAQRAAIFSGNQSPSASTPASTPEGSSTDSQEDTLELPRVVSP